MNPKLLVGILFLVVFTISFAIYLIVVNIINPHIDLSTTTKKSIEVAPELNSSSFVKGVRDDKVTSLQENAMQDSDTYEPDISDMLKESGSDSAENVDDSENKNLPGVLDSGKPGEIKAPAEGGHASATTANASSSATNGNLDLPVIDTTGNKPLLPNTNKTGTGENFVPDSTIKDKKAPDAATGNSVNRVVVGSYGSIDDAKKAYDKMVNSDLDVAPIIKEVDGNYTLQVGAFTDKEKAENMVKTLNNKNYSATIKKD